MANTDAPQRETGAIKNFFDSVSSATEDGSGGHRRLTTDAAKELLTDPATRIPNSVQTLLGRFDPAHHPIILDSVLSGQRYYEKLHGCAPDASVAEAALRGAVAATTPIKELGISGVRYDSATSLHHDQLSLQPATAVVSVMAQFAEAIPWAVTLPADIKSNEARLNIVTNQALSGFGAYVAGESLDGISLGKKYLQAERVISVLTNGGGGASVAFNAVVRDGVAYNATTNPSPKLLRGRTTILVNGLPSAFEVRSTSGTGAAGIAGSATIAGTTYTISGSIDADTGVGAFQSAPALPAGTKVDALVYVDFERSPELTPRIGIESTTYSMFAYASRGLVQVSVDANTQMNSEIGLDPRGQSLASLRAQFTAERHFSAFYKMKAAAANLPATWVYDYATQNPQKDRSQMWLNLLPILSGLSQQMANMNGNHGITHLYVTGELNAQLDLLPSTMWQSSGLRDRPGIFRRGTLANRYEVYYTPIGLTETGGGSASEILCVGKATDVARNPIVFADAVPAMFLPLATGADMVSQDGFYTRGLTELNPHRPSQFGSALITVTGIK